MHPTEEGEMAEAKKGPLAAFKDFLLRGNVVDLAIAVVIGVAFGNVVKAFIADMITPVVSIFSKHTNFEDLAFHIRGATFAYGDFFNNVFTFVILAAVVFFLVVQPVAYMIDRRKRSLAEGDADAAGTMSDEAALLTEIRDLLKARGGAIG